MSIAIPLRDPKIKKKINKKILKERTKKKIKQTIFALEQKSINGAFTSADFKTMIGYSNKTSIYDKKQGVEEVAICSIDIYVSGFSV